MIPVKRLALLVVLAMIAFAANSLLCRMALRYTAIDPASFTTIRIASGAVVLWAIARMRDGTMTSAGSWGSAAALFGYAAAFSFAYNELSAAVGALILFCAVQVTMIGWGLWSGERIGATQAAGLSLAIGGLVGLLCPVAARSSCCRRESRGESIRSGASARAIRRSRPRGISCGPFRWP